MNMEPIFPITALQKKPADVKAAAQENLARITENGLGAYVFAAEDVYERKLQEAVEEAVYIARVSDLIERGRTDYEAGRYYEGTNVFLAEMKQREQEHA